MPTSSRGNFIAPPSDELATGESYRRATSANLRAIGLAPILSAPARPERDFDELACEAPSLHNHRTAIFAHEVANSLSAIGFAVEYFKGEFEARRIDDALLKRTLQSALGEIAGLGLFLRQHCASPQSETLDFEVVDVTQLVEDALALQSLACLAAGVMVGFDCAPAIIWARLDAPKIKQVIANLCKNAMEAMADGGRLSVKVYCSGPSAILEMTDNGIGIPADVDVFELFKTTKRSGRGLGLPVAREIVAAHGGTIAYVSELGAGATFKVTLQLSEPQP